MTSRFCQTGFVKALCTTVCLEECDAVFMRSSGLLRSLRLMPRRSRRKTMGWLRLLPAKLLHRLMRSALAMNLGEWLRKTHEISFNNCPPVGIRYSLEGLRLIKTLAQFCLSVVSPQQTVALFCAVPPALSRPSQGRTASERDTFGTPGCRNCRQQDNCSQRQDSKPEPAFPTML